MTLRVRAERILDDLQIGDSVAHDGVCLTVVERDGRDYVCEIMRETLARTTLGEKRVGARVNLERALSASGRLGGHFVQGHVDAVGVLRSIRREADWVVHAITAPPEVLRYVVRKGSIAVDGVSLTVAERLPDGFEVALIPHTLAATTLGERRVGERVNLEADILAKYVEAALAERRQGSPLSLEWLAEQGFGGERRTDG